MRGQLNVKFVARFQVSTSDIFRPAAVEIIVRDKNTSFVVATPYMINFTFWSSLCHYELWYVAHVTANQTTRCRKPYDKCEALHLNFEWTITWLYGLKNPVSIVFLVCLIVSNASVFNSLLRTVGFIYPHIYMDFSSILRRNKIFRSLTLILLTWRIWWAPNNASRWQMGFNLAFKGLTDRIFLTYIGIYYIYMYIYYLYIYIYICLREGKRSHIFFIVTISTCLSTVID